MSFKQQSPTVIAADHFNPRRDAEVLKKAMKGFGAHENTIIKLLTKRSNAQRVEIALKYKTLYGKNLTKELKSELSGSLEKTVVALMTPLRQYYAKELHNAIVGLGTDEAVLIEVLCTLPNTEIRAISTIYHKSKPISTPHSSFSNTPINFQFTIKTLKVTSKATLVETFVASWCPYAAQDATKAW